VGGAAATSAGSISQTPSQAVNPGERSSSAFPTLIESMRSLSINAAAALTKDPRSQSVRQPNHRRELCSAVPDSAVLTPVLRPDEGGRNGQEIDVYTNHFRVDIGDAVVYQYDINIVMIDRNGRSRLSRKDDRWEVLQTIVKERKDFPTIW
jgi:hypothetical protein